MEADGRSLRTDMQRDRGIAYIRSTGLILEYLLGGQLETSYWLVPSVRPSPFVWWRQAKQYLLRALH